MKTNVIYYSLSVWLTSVIVAPIMVVLYYAWKDQMSPDRELVPLMLMYGGAFSIPSLIVLGLSCNYLVRRRDTVKAVKIPLTIISVILTYAPFWVLNDYSFTDSSGTVSMFFSSYCITIVAGIWLYRLKGVGDVTVEDTAS